MKRGSQEDELVFLNRKDKKDRVFSQEKMRTSMDQEKDKGKRSHVLI